MKVVLRGLAENVFGGVLCLRGYASLGMLADASAIENYQRQADERHIKEIKEFFEDINHSFFPELILGVSLEELGLDADNRQLFYNMMKDPNGVTTKKLCEGFVIGIGAISANSLDRVISLRVECQDRVFKRIDGNHRLEAVPKKSDEDTHDVRSRIVPYCIVLFETAEKALYNGTMFFHNINYRALPLPEEKSLQVILEAKDCDGVHIFSKEMLQGAAFFGKPYYYARKFLEWVDFSAFPYSEDLFKSDKRTISLQLFRELCKHVGESEIVVMMAVQAMSRMEQLIKKRGITRNYGVGLIVSLFYFTIVNDGKDAEAFSMWINACGLKSMRDLVACDVISIYEGTHKRGPYKVFVAMPFVSMAHVKEFNSLFKEALDDLNKNEAADHVRYELTPIMLFRGASQRIDQRLIEKIKECDIFIADITGKNENVIFEIGLAQGYGKPSLLIRAEDDKNVGRVMLKDETFEVNWEYVKYVREGRTVPFDMDKLQYIPYSLTGYYNGIKDIVRNNLPEIAKQLKYK